MKKAQKSSGLLLMDLPLRRMAYYTSGTMTKKITSLKMISQDYFKRGFFIEYVSIKL